LQTKLVLLTYLDGQDIGDWRPGHPDQGLPGQRPHPSHPIVIPPGAVAPGVPTHPIYLPGTPDQGLPPFPSQGLPGGTPGIPGVPSHPIHFPTYPDQGLPGSQPRPDQGLPGYGHPSHPIVYPPGLPNQDLPATPGLPPLVPSHPIVLPDGLPPGSVVAIPLPVDKLPAPKDVPAGSTPYILWGGAGTMPTVAWLPPLATPKK
jgi:hypothetical protein